MKNKKKIFAALFAALLVTTPVAAVNHHVSAAQNKIVIKKTWNNYVPAYTKSGKEATTTQTVNGKKWTVAANETSGKTLTYKGKPVIIKGPKVLDQYTNYYGHSISKPGHHYEPATYFNIGKGRYVKAIAVSSMNGKGVMILNSNSAIYNAYGQRISYQGKRTLPKYMIVNYIGATHSTRKSDRYFFFSNLSGTKKTSLKTYTINGKKYYQIAKGAYINVANVGMINGNAVFQKGGSTTAIPRVSLNIYNYKFKVTKKTVKAGQKITVNQAKSKGSGDDASLFFRISGTKGKNAQYIYWGDDSMYGYNEGDHTDEFSGNFSLRARLAE